MTWSWLCSYLLALAAVVAAGTLLGAACLAARDLLLAYVNWRLREGLPLVPLGPAVRAVSASWGAPRPDGTSALGWRHLPLLLTVWMAGFIALAPLATPRLPYQAGPFVTVICLLVSLVATVALTLLFRRLWRALWLVAFAIMLHERDYQACLFLLLIAAVSAVWDHDGAARTQQLSSILQELAEALRLRLPLDALFVALGHDRPGVFTAHLATVARRLRNGHALSSALDQAGFLPRYAVVGVRAGEDGGGREMAAVAQALADGLRQDAQARSIVGSALLYPFTVWAACASCAIFLAFGPLHRYVEALHFIKHPSVRWQAEFASLVVDALPYAIGLVLAAILLHAYLGAWAQRFAWSDGLWQAVSWRLADMVPVLRARLRNRCLARCARLIAVLLRSGVPLHEACQLAGSPGMAGPYTAAFRELGRKVQAGGAIKEAAQDAGLPASFRALLQVGATGGELERALLVAAEWHAARAERQDHVLGVMLTCLSLLLIGAMIGSIAYIIFSAWCAARDYYVRFVMPWA